MLVRYFTFCIVSVIVLFDLSLSAKGHEYTPAYFSLSEKTQGQFSMQWKVDTMAGLNKQLTPQVTSNTSSTCLVELLSIESLNEAEIYHSRLNCTATIEDVTIKINGLSASKTDVLFRVNYLNGDSENYRLTPQNDSVVLTGQASFWQVITTYTVLGFEHILIGLDHLLFVLALLLLLNNMKVLIQTITAFTVAHSLTLAATTLGWVNVSSEPVETTIAISILFLALQLVKNSRVKGLPSSQKPQDLANQFPWLVAFSFGLLHGFGFAGVLAEIGLPENDIVLSLLFFNIGVELGQLFFVALVFAFAWAYRQFKLSIPYWWKNAIAYSIGSLSVCWIIERSTWLIL